MEKCRPDAAAPLIERVGYALNHFPNLEGKPEGFDEEIFDLLFSSADLHNFAPEDKVKYHNDMTTERDIKNQIDFAYDKGQAEGREQTLLETARAMLADGMSAELISRYTGLSQEVVRGL